MNKKILSILMIGMVFMTLFSGCGKKNEENAPEEEAVGTLEYAIIKDNVKVGKYKGISVNGYNTSVTEADIDSFIDYVLQHTSVENTSDASAESSSQDDGASSASTEKTQPALTHEQLTDDLVVKISDGQYSNVADYRAYVKDTIKAQNESYYTDTIKSDLFNVVKASSALAAYSEDDLAHYIKYANEYYAEYAEYLGLDLNTFITENMGLESEDKFNEYVQDEARQNLLREYIIIAIAEEEGITVTDTEINTEIQKYIEQGYFATEDEVLEYITRDEIALNLKYNKILEIIYENANIIPYQEEQTEEAATDDSIQDNVEVVEEAVTEEISSEN